MCELTRLSDDGTPPVDGAPVLGFTIVGVVLIGRIDIILCRGNMSASRNCMPSSLCCNMYCSILRAHFHAKSVGQLISLQS